MAFAEFMSATAVLSARSIGAENLSPRNTRLQDVDTSSASMIVVSKNNRWTRSTLAVAMALFRRDNVRGRDSIGRSSLKTIRTAVAATGIALAASITMAGPAATAPVIGDPAVQAHPHYVNSALQAHPHYGSSAGRARPHQVGSQVQETSSPRTGAVHRRPSRRSANHFTGGFFW